jgi:hypothetical protein
MFKHEILLNFIVNVCKAIDISEKFERFNGKNYK